MLAKEQKRGRLRQAVSGSTLALAVAAAAPVAAQAVPPAIPPQLPSQSDISRGRVVLPLPETHNFDLRIQAPERSAIPKAVDELDFNLKRVVVEGATVFPPEKVNALFTPLTEHTVRLTQLRAAAARLEDLYHAHGYFLSRVFVPPQRLEDGTLKIRVVEGYIGRVQVAGLDERSRRLAAGILQPLQGKRPVDLASVERCLLILNDLPGLTATSVLREGTVLGASDLYVTLAKSKNVVQASVNNTNSLILGPWNYSLGGNLDRPLGLPGSLALSLSASGPAMGATQSASLRYAAGLNKTGMIGSLGVIVSRAHPGASLTPLDVRNDLVSVSTRLRYPIIRSRAVSLFVEAGLSVNRSTTAILQQQLVNDHDTVADLALTYQQNGFLKGTTTASLDLYRGLPILGANGSSAPHPSVLNFNPGFVRITYSLQRVQNFAPRVSAVLSVQGQYSESKLLSGEQIAFGGPAIGRGYDPSTITGDRGIGGLAELRYDLPVGRRWLANAQFYAFVDAARATTLPDLTAGKITARTSSGGVGVRLFQRLAMIDLEGAKAFIHNSGSNKRSDPRLLLSVTTTY